ncbi:hypothetical protein GF343_04955 [Candidatus Woesearchaeota archaeon]|nr:hypothetical protein [Candidatus Woesearchaeota archaeon]
MKIFICASKHCYHLIAPIKEELEKQGHSITLPNSYEDPMHEERLKQESTEKHAEFKSAMLKLQEQKIKANDALLICNFEKHGQSNYIGGATFLEIFKAFELGKKIFLINPIPDNILKDEIVGMQPVIINQDLSKIKK